MQRTLSSAQKTLDNLDRNVADPSSPVQRNLEDTLQELQRTARALRLLSDYLQQHPEALLRGKPADAPVPQPLSLRPCDSDCIPFVARRVRCGEPVSSSACSPSPRAARRRRPTSTA